MSSIMFSWLKCNVYRELRSHFRLHPQVLGYCPPLLVLLGDDGELEPLVVLEEGEHAGGDLGVRGLHPGEGWVSANMRRGQAQCEVLLLCLGRCFHKSRQNLSWNRK